MTPVIKETDFPYPQLLWTEEPVLYSAPAY